MLNDSRVSRTHALIVQNSEGSYEIRDEQSRFGTSVNGESVTAKVLQDGDRISFGGGGTAIVFRTRPDDKPSRDWLSSSSSIRSASELEQLNLFLQAARSLNTTRVLDDVLQILLDYTLKITGAERGFVFLRQPTGELSLAQGRDNKGNAITEASGISNSVLNDCANSNVEFLIGDAAREDLAERNSIIALDLRTVIAIPLRLMNTDSAIKTMPIVGVLYLDSHFTTHNLSGCSPEILRAIATEAARVVENARLAQAEQEALQYQRELSIASSIQKLLSNARLPQTRFLELDARTIPCKEVGGDVYDAVITPNGVAVVLADVSGKGISAALLASVIQGMLYAEFSAGMPILRAITGLNRFLCERVGGQKYATLLVAEIREDGSTELICCGHLPPLLVRNGEVIKMTEGCVPVGLFEDGCFSTQRVQLQAGDQLIFITDGVTEAMNDKAEEFGDDRFEQCAKQPNFMDYTFAQLRQFLGPQPLQDDCSLVGISFKG